MLAATALHKISVPSRRPLPRAAPAQIHRAGPDARGAPLQRGGALGGTELWQCQHRSSPSLLSSSAVVPAAPGSAGSTEPLNA